MVDVLADSDAKGDDDRVFAEHQTILAIVHGILDDAGVDEYAWLDVACGKGKIIAHLIATFQT